MAHYTNDASVDNKVHLYMKVPEEPSEINSIKLLLRKHNRLHTISLVLHAVWLLVIVVLLVLLLKTPAIPQTTTSVQQVPEPTGDGQTSITEKYSTAVRALNSTLTQVCNQQQALNSTYQNLKQQLENHELAANDSFTDLNSQQQNATDALRSEFKDQLETIKQGMEESANKTLEYLSGLGDLDDLTGPTTAPNRLPVYNQEETITDYLYQDGLPALSEFTVCFWFNAEDGTSWTGGCPMSISVPGEPNEWMLSLNYQGIPEVWIRDRLKDMTTNASDIDTLWVGWNRHCFTWKAGYTMKWYTDRMTNGRLELMGSADVSDDTVRDGGHLVLLHGGRLQVRQTLHGKLADFNMWNHEMTADQINTLTCGGVGNVASWDTLQQQGTEQMTYEYFAQCKTRTLPVYNQEQTTANYLYQDGLPALSELTVCFWFNAEATGSWRSSCPISISVPRRDSEWVILLYDSGKPEIYIRGYPTFMTTNTSNTASLWVGWNRHCFTWKGGYTVKWYTDIITNGRLELMGTTDVSTSRDTLRSGGHLTLLHAQDTQRGYTELYNTVSGQLADFNMWDYEMTADQINTLTCGGVGNVASWDTLQQHGTGQITYEEFPSCAFM